MQRLAWCPLCRIPAIAVFVPLLIVSFVAAPCSNAPTQQLFLFAGDVANSQLKDIAVFVRNDQTGDLTEASGSPFTNLHSMKCMMQVVDPKGRFGYGPCGRR